MQCCRQISIGNRSLILSSSWPWSCAQLGPMRNAFVTGAAGFIGSNLVDRLLKADTEVVGWDNLSTGQEEFLRDARTFKQFRFVRGDNLDLPALKVAMAGCDFVFHVAANADVRFGIDHPKRDL